MRMGLLVTLVLVITATMLPIAVGQAQEAQEKKTEDCSLPKRWDPAEDLPRILAEHREWAVQWEKNRLSKQWVEDHPEGRANLCNANLQGAKVKDADLRGAELNDADLRGAELNNANLWYAELNNTNLQVAKLNNANLWNAKLNNANMQVAKLNNANMQVAKLNNANLWNAELNNTDLQGAELNNVNLVESKLNNAKLLWAKLNNSKLLVTEVKDANFAFASLGGSIYAPASPPPNPYLEGIEGLSTVSFPEGSGEGSGSGLVQLRELLQKAGLRDLERQATYALESNRTWHAITGEWSNPIDRLEGAFKFLFFEVTTGYGLYPGRALRFIVYLGFVLILVYIWPIRFSPQRSAPASRPSGSIYRIWSADRVETAWDAEHHSEEIMIRNAVKVERLVGGWWFASRYALYFSLLSAFSIGWKDFNVGSWIARIQAREYALRATGWVRIVSGLQSLLSVYLLAIWVLTYFGRPFQ